MILLKAILRVLAAGLGIVGLALYIPVMLIPSKRFQPLADWLRIETMLRKCGKGYLKVFSDFIGSPCHTGLRPLGELSWLQIVSWHIVIAVVLGIPFVTLVALIVMLVLKNVFGFDC